jgi:hypothetical protein
MGDQIKQAAIAYDIVHDYMRKNAFSAGTAMTLNRIYEALKDKIKSPITVRDALRNRTDAHRMPCGIKGRKGNRGYAWWLAEEGPGVIGRVQITKPEQLDDVQGTKKPHIHVTRERVVIEFDEVKVTVELKG